MKKLLIIPILLFFALESQADVFNVDSAVTAEGDSTDTSIQIATGGETGNDREGDYNLIMCSTGAFDDNSLFSPSPGEWTEIDNGNCADGSLGGDSQSCVLGVWGMFSDTDEVEDITCSWSERQFTSVAGSFRYRNVDINNPIIGSECQSGFGTIATAPSIESEEGAQVVRIAAFTFVEGISCPGQVTQNNGSSIEACSNEDVVNISLDAETIFDAAGGATGVAEIPLLNGFDTPANWRACTVALRMNPETRPIPTLSEWGFVAVAAFMGAAGVWYLRRKQTQAS